MPKRLGDDWCFDASPLVDVTFDISTTPRNYPYAILFEPSDDGCHIGIPLSKVVKGIRHQWWLEIRIMQGVPKANSIVDWLDEKITNPRTHEWGWDRLPFFDPTSRSRARKLDPRWQERVDATQPRLKELVASRKRKTYDVAGPAVIPLEIQHGTKRRFEELEDEDEDEDEDEEKVRSEEQEPTSSREEIWDEQVRLTMKDLNENHKKMKKQGVDLPYFESYRTYSLQ